MVVLKITLNVAAGGGNDDCVGWLLEEQGVVEGYIGRGVPGVFVKAGALAGSKSSLRGM